MEDAEGGDLRNVVRPLLRGEETHQKRILCRDAALPLLLVEAIRGGGEHFAHACARGQAPRGHGAVRTNAKLLLRRRSVAEHVDRAEDFLDVRLCEEALALRVLPKDDCSGAQ